MAKSLVVSRTPPPDIKLRRAELRLKKRELKHKQRLDYLDRAIDITKPILTSPVTMLIGSYALLEYAEVKYREYIARPGGMGFWDDLGLSAELIALRGAILAAFVGNAFGGPSGITKIIQAVK